MTAENDFDDSDEDLFDEDLCALLDSTVADLSALGNNQQNGEKIAHGVVVPQRDEKKEHIGLKWNAASSLSRAAAAAEKRSSSLASPLPVVKDQMPVARQVNASIELPQKAQISEMQRQIDSYKQQLIFKQQEIEELKRQSNRAHPTVDVGGRAKRFQSPSSVTIQGEKGSPLLMTSKRRMEPPITPSVEKSALSGDGSMPCLVPMRRVSLGRQAPLVDILDSLERYIDGVRHYRRIRPSIFLVDGQQDDVGNAVLVNLESALLLRKHANLKDVFILILSAIVHVIHVDCLMVMQKYQVLENGGGMENGESSSVTNLTRSNAHSVKELETCMEELTKFVGSLFEVLNELVMDSGMCSKMIELIQDPVDPLDAIKPVEKNVTHTIIQILDTILVLEEYCGVSVESTVASIVQFMHHGVRLRTESAKSIFAPILKSKQIQQLLLRYPSIRKRCLTLIMIFLEDRSTLTTMEQLASQDLQVSSSEKLLKENQSPSTGLRTRTHRRHSITQKRIDQASHEDSCAWASRLVQTVSLCLSMDHDVAHVGSWETVRMCLAFFANIIDRFSEALLASVLIQEKLESYNVQGMFAPGKMPDHLRVVKTLPLYLIDIADKASGSTSSNESITPHVALLHPTCPTGISSQNMGLKMLRIVQESLMLLRGFMTHSRFGIETTRLLADENNWVLCVLEKMAHYPELQSGSFSGGYPLALWVRRTTFKNESGQHDDPCYPTVDSVIHVSRMMKFAVLKQLDKL